MDHNDITKILESKNWIFAKTMPQSPHWYTLRKEWLNNDLFDAVVTFIRDHGYQEKYKRTFYTMINFNEYKYWTMGSPINETILINRTPINPDDAYKIVRNI